MEMSLSQMVLGYVAYYLNPMYFFYGIAFLIRWQYFLIIEDRETMNSILKKLRQDNNFHKWTLKEHQKLWVRQMFWSMSQCN